METWVYFVCLAILATSIKGSPVSIIAPRDDDPYRIPEGLIKVNSYNLELSLLEDVFDTNTFQGVLDLNFDLLQDTNVIKVHADGIEFSELTLKDSNNNEIDLENNGIFTIDSVTTFVTITTSETLLSGSGYTFHFNYKSQLRTDEFRGLYKSSYITSTGEEKFLATTQFQTTFARRAFPCFDEPSYKAVFVISIIHPNQLNAKSNTPGTEQALTDMPGYTKTTFLQTPVMPTYLIAFIISEFTCTDGAEVEDNLPSGVCSQPETEDIRALAVDLGPKIIWALEDLTGVKYSESGIGKLHQFAIPDFAAGAMENWGLVTYREYYLLWDPAHSTNRYKQNVATIISHEFGHFWFGDLVTTHWWSDTFLNEGFATYCEWFGVAQVLPEWELDKQFVIEELHYGMSVDQSLTSLPLSSPASSPAEVSARFGTVSYSKGGSVFRMVEHFMGTENFKLGITNYLTKNKFSNTKPEDLWEALNPHATNLPASTLGDVMYNWVNYPGFPLLKVTVTGNNVGISQQRFLLSGTPDPNHKWYVPLTYTTSSDARRFESTTTRTWLLPDQNLNLNNVISGTDPWIILNNYQIGYYRIDYDATTRSNILKALKKPGFDDIPDLNRGQLVDDLYYMARAEIYSFVEFLDFISFLENDESYFAWYEAFTGINYILARVGETRVRTALHAYLARLIQVFYNSAQFIDAKDDNQIHSLKRVQAASWGCRLGLENCKNNAIAAFANYRSTQIKPDKNLRSTIYCNGLRYSNDISNDWDFLFSKYLVETGTLEKSSILAALGCPLDQQAVTKYLQKSIDSTSGLTKGDLASVFSAIYTNNYEGIDTLLDFAINNHKAINDFSGSYDAVDTLISNVGSRFSRSEQVEKLDNFIETSDLPDASKSKARSVLTSARTRIQWIETFEKQLTTFFELENDSENGGNGGGGESDAIISSRAQFAIIIAACFLALQNM